MRAMRMFSFSVLCVVAVSCRTTPPAAVSHVVIVWLKSPGDQTARQRIIDETQNLRKIPGVLGVIAGRPVPSTRPIVDSSFDVGIVITFKDEAAMRAYETNPIHVKARNEVLRPLAGKLLIYDIKKEADAVMTPAWGNGMDKPAATTQPAAIETTKR
jgi:hypothetical protein